MNVFKEEDETKRIIFNVRLDLADRLERAKKHSRAIGKRLDADTAVDKALEKFLKKAEKKIAELLEKRGITPDPLTGAEEAIGGPGDGDMEDDEET